MEIVSTRNIVSCDRCKFLTGRLPICHTSCVIQLSERQFELFSDCPYFGLALQINAVKSATSITQAIRQREGFTTKTASIRSDFKCIRKVKYATIFKKRRSVSIQMVAMISNRLKYVIFIYRHTGSYGQAAFAGFTSPSLFTRLGPGFVPRSSYKRREIALTLVTLSNANTLLERKIANQEYGY